MDVWQFLSGEQYDGAFAVVFALLIVVFALGLGVWYVTPLWFAHREKMKAIEYESDTEDESCK